MNLSVSVIIPTFNRSALLKRAVESVLAQSYRGFELMVVDDGSDDDTPELVAGFEDSIRYIRQENRGPSAARNVGITNAGGEFIAFLDSDDWWDREKLAMQMGEMERQPSCLISHTQEIWYRGGSLLNQKKKHRKFHGYIFDKCLPLCAVSLSTVIARRELFGRVGLFDEALPCCEDYDFWLRASVHHPFLLLDRPLTLKDGGRPDQVSHIYRTGMDKFRIRALVKILSEPNLLTPEQRKLALGELERKCRIYGTGCIKHGKMEEGRYHLELPKKFGVPGC